MRRPFPTAARRSAPTAGWQRRAELGRAASPRRSLDLSFHLRSSVDALPVTPCTRIPRKLLSLISSDQQQQIYPLQPMIRPTRNRPVEMTLRRSRIWIEPSSRPPKKCVLIGRSSCRWNELRKWRWHPSCLPGLSYWAVFYCYLSPPEPTISEM
jgi:hypothetical protein